MTFYYICNAFKIKVAFGQDVEIPQRLLFK